MRKETIVTQLWHGCGAFKKFGMSTAELIFGDDRKTLEKYPYHGNYTYVTVSSPEVVWAYEEAMSLQDKRAWLCQPVFPVRISSMMKKQKGSTGKTAFGSATGKG